jgi:hypothetical protein
MQIAGNTQDISSLSFVGVLTLALQVEYYIIVNYPRVIDQIASSEIGAAEKDEAVKTLTVLGQESIQHADVTAELTRRFGGKPQFDFELLDTPRDTGAWLLEVLEREKFALSLYEQARRVVERRRTGSLYARMKGRFASLLPGQRSNTEHVIATLAGLAAAERKHIELANKVISALGL